MSEIYAEEVLALSEEVEGELLNVSLVYDEDQDRVERILSNVARDSEVEEAVEGEGEEQIGQEDGWKLVEEKLKVVCEETKTIWVFV